MADYTYLSYINGPNITSLIMYIIRIIICINSRPLADQWPRGKDVTNKCLVHPLPNGAPFNKGVFAAAILPENLPSYIMA